MNIELYNYLLPEDRLALFPAKRRDISRLMSLDRETGEIGHGKFTQVIDFLNPGDGLVVNNTKVFKARLFSRRPSGGKVEVFLLGELAEGKGTLWEVLTHPTRRIHEGERLVLGDDDGFEVFQKKPDGKTVIRFRNKPEAARLIAKYGHVPLPIYIHRPDQKSDESRYQTVYAHERKAKSVAAPTAGLHFSDTLLDKIKKKGIKIIPVTLHVGYGTFKSVKTENIEEHVVDPESAEITKSSAQAINKVRKEGGKIIAVGTTSVRTLESAPMVDGEIQPFNSPVDLYIRPGFEFRVVDHLITNFHLPKSSLIILASAFAGREKILEAYRIAVENGYRFYSYGDAMIIL